MIDALKERMANAAWNIKLFQSVECDPTYYYLVGMAQADLKVAEGILEELTSDEP